MKKYILITTFLFGVTLLFTTKLTAQTTHLNKGVKEYTKLADALKEPEKVLRLNLSNQVTNNSLAGLAKLINLQYLSLRNNRLTIVPKEIAVLKTLTVLDLGGNDISLLPQNFSNLINLQELYLDEDKKLALAADIEILSKLPSLKILHLENDDLKVLPKNINKLSHLEQLYLGYNYLQTVPLEIKGLKNLKVLDLNHNPVSPHSALIKQTHGGLKIRF